MKIRSHLNYLQTTPFIETTSQRFKSIVLLSILYLSTPTLVIFAICILIPAVILSTFLLLKQTFFDQSLEFGFTNMSFIMEMETLYTRCSICFDSHLDFCLRRCKDQFCYECFERYVKETVKNSWGLSVQKITCPVCYDPIEQHEWENYVDSTVVAQYNQFNRPYRALTRACGKCGNESACVERPLVSRCEREQTFDKMYTMIEDMVAADGHLTSYTYSILSKFQADYHGHLRGSGIGVSQIYQELMPNLEKCLGWNALQLSSSPVHYPMGHPEHRHFSTLCELSKLLICLENRPEQWRELQFTHVKQFPMQEW